MDDTTRLLTLIGGGFLLLMLVFSTALSFFVGLKSPPVRRASWTAGIAAVLSALTAQWMLSTVPDMPDQALPGEIQWGGPLAIIAGVILVFLFWYWTFRRAWRDEEEALAADGVGIEDDDWKIGLFRLVMLIALALTAGMFRIVMRSF